MGRFKRREDADDGDVTWSSAPPPQVAGSWGKTWRPTLRAGAADASDGVWRPVPVAQGVPERSPPAAAVPKAGDAGFDVWQPAAKAPATDTASPSVPQVRAAAVPDDTGLPAPPAPFADVQDDGRPPEPGPEAEAGALDDTVPSGLLAITVAVQTVPAAAVLAPDVAEPAQSWAAPAPAQAPAPAPAAVKPAAAGPPQGHRGRLRLVRRPLTLVILAAGLLAVVGGTAGLTRLTGHPGQVARPLPKASPAPHGPFAAPPPHHAGHPVSLPVALVIPAIGVRTSLIHLGRTPQGTLQVPSSTTVAGWYTGSPRPGEIGSSIIAGHIDSTTGPAVFFRLPLLRPGNLVYVRRASGALAVFRVYAEHVYTKASFPTQQVYGPEPDAELHLITCGGVFDQATGSYLSNVVVYATEVGHRPPPHRHHGGRRHAHQPRARH